MNARTTKLSHGARMVGAAILAVPIFLTPATSPASVSEPIAEIVNPENSKVFRPGDVPLVDGNAFAGLGVHAVRLEFWLLNKMERAVLAECGACLSSTASYWNYEAEDLLPGYYIVKAYAVDNSGKWSPAAQRGFVYGLQTINTPNTPGTPGTPGVPGGQIPPPTIDQPPNIPLPGAEGPVAIPGETSGGDQTVRMRETDLGPVGKVQSDDDGNYIFNMRLPTGVYKFRVRAIEEDGGRSKWSRVYKIRVDADRPILGIGTPAETVFSSLDPIAIEGELFDQQRPARVKVEYWLLDKLVLVQDAERTMLDSQTMAWSARPSGLNPGYYYVRVTAWDRAGNAAHSASTTFLYAL